jgi:hypothetical protein
MLQAAMGGTEEPQNQVSEAERIMREDRAVLRGLADHDRGGQAGSAEI